MFYLKIHWTLYSFHFISKCVFMHLASVRCDWCFRNTTNTIIWHLRVPFILILGCYIHQDSQVNRASNRYIIYFLFYLLWLWRLWSFTVACLQARDPVKLLVMIQFANGLLRNIVSCQKHMLHFMFCIYTERNPTLPSSQKFIKRIILKFLKTITLIVCACLNNE